MSLSTSKPKRLTIMVEEQTMKNLEEIQMQKRLSIGQIVRDALWNHYGIPAADPKAHR